MKEDGDAAKLNESYTLKSEFNELNRKMVRLDLEYAIEYIEDGDIEHAERSIAEAAKSLRQFAEIKAQCDFISSLIDCIEAGDFDD